MYGSSSSSLLSTFCLLNSALLVNDTEREILAGVSQRLAAQPNFHRVELVYDAASLPVSRRVAIPLIVEKSLVRAMPTIVMDNAERLRNYSYNGGGGNARINLLVLLLVRAGDDLGLDESRRVLDRYADLAINATRPRVLLVGRGLDERAAESLLLHAWQRKYLDVTLVDSQAGRLSYYVPFVRRYCAIAYDNARTELFPDKFAYVAGYPLTLLYTASNDQRVVANQPLHFSLERFLRPATRMRFVPRQVANFGEALRVLERHDEESVFLPYLVQIGMAVPDTGLQLGRVAFFDWLGAVGWRRNRVKVSMMNIGGYGWLYGALLLLVFVALRLAELVMLGRRLLHWLDFYGLVIGQYRSKPMEASGDMRPTQKVMLLLMLLMSIVYSSTLVSLVTRKLFSYEDAQISSYEQLIKTGLQPYVYYQSVRYLVNGSDPWAAKLRRIALTFQPGYDCLKSLAEDENRVCFTSMSKAIVTERQLVDGQPRYEVFRLKVNQQPYGIVYEPASVYAAFIDRLVQHGVQQHLQHCWACPMGNEQDMRNAKRDLDIDDSVDCYWLLLIVILGQSSAALVFVAELVAHRFFLNGTQ